MRATLLKYTPIYHDARSTYPLLITSTHPRMLLSGILKVGLSPLN